MGCFGGWLLRGEASPTNGEPSRRSRLLLRSIGSASQPLAGCADRRAFDGAPIRIQGGMTTTVTVVEMVWLWVSEEGRLMTEDEIAAESGGHRLLTPGEGGTGVNSGTGVSMAGLEFRYRGAHTIWNRAAAERARPRLLGLGHERRAFLRPRCSRYTGPGSASVYSTHQGILATPPGLL